MTTTDSPPACLHDPGLATLTRDTLRCLYVWHCWKCGRLMETQTEVIALLPARDRVLWP
jgi:hypothetical protein